MRREKVYTVGLPTGAGPARSIIHMNLADNVCAIEIEAWIGNFGSSNAYIFDSGISLTECINRVSDDLGPDSIIDCLMALTGSGPVKVQADTDVRHLTVFFEAANNSGQTETVTIKVTEIM